MGTNAAPFLTISVSSKLEQWWVQNHYWFSTALTMYHTEGHNHHHDNHAGDGENFQLLEYAVLSPPPTVLYYSAVTKNLKL